MILSNLDAISCGCFLGETLYVPHLHKGLMLVWINEWSGYLYTAFIGSLTRSWSGLLYISQTYQWAAYLGRIELGHMFMVNFLFSHHLFRHIHIFSFFIIHFLFFSPHCLHVLIFIFTVRAGYLYVTDTLSTPTIMEPLSVECQDLFIYSNAFFSYFPYQSNSYIWAVSSLIQRQNYEI